jgi:signal peptidase II
MPENRRVPLKYLLFGGVAAGLVALDQVTKWLVGHYIPRGHEIPVIDGFFSLVHAQNTGAVLGILGDLPTGVRIPIFAVFTLIAVIVLLSMLRQLHARDRFQSIMLAFIFAGAIGNAIDRLLFFRVTDFLRFYTEQPALKAWLVAHLKTNEYPSFNVADSAIVVGVGLFLVRYIFLKDKKSPEDDEDAPTEESAVENAGGGTERS